MDSELPENKTGLFYLKRTFGFILLLAMAATFFYSAYTKSGVEFRGFRLVDTPDATNAFDSFQWTFLDLGISSMVVAGVIARVLIGFEFMLGLFLLFHIYLRKFTYKAVIAVLTVFIIYLLVVILKQGNSGNCGCFGNKVSMTPLNAIWKNVAMIAVTVLLMFIYPVKPYRHQEYVGMVVAAIGFTVPFVVNMMYVGTAPVKYANPIDLNPLYQYTPAPAVDLRKGKHILALMSLTCPHCKKAAYLLQVIHREHPEIPMFIVLDGAEPHLKSFFDETHAEHVPHLFYQHTKEFEDLVNSGLKKGDHGGVPTIFWVNNGMIEYKSVYAYYQLDPKYMVQWLNAK